MELCLVLVSISGMSSLATLATSSSPSSPPYPSMGTTMEDQDEDCYSWNEETNFLYGGYDSCKAELLEQIWRYWHKLFGLNVVFLVFLVVYARLLELSEMLVGFTDFRRPAAW